ncbi:MAG: DoxX family protein [Mucilaginibacter polytrichastri]|nr:DoxX family protein [Mucilaginibacter polytrichastri]
MTIYERALLLKIRIINWKIKHGLHTLRLALGLVFFWFGVIKFFHGLSPAEQLATRTISTLTLGLIKPGISVYILATWETLIGLGLLSGMFLHVTLLLLYFQMAGTFLPMVFFPHEIWTHHFLVPTLEGQYIIKNCVLISAGIVIGSTVEGGGIIAGPAARHLAEKYNARFFSEQIQMEQDKESGEE